MPRHAVKLLATIGACSALAFAFPSGAGAEEFVTPHVTVPHVNVPKPHITVPTVNSNAPTVNLQHHRQSTGTDTLTNEKLNATTTTVNTPVVGPSNGGGPAGAKIIIESVGGSGTPAQVQQQNAGAAAAAAAAAAATASNGAGSPGGPAKILDIPGSNQSGNSGLNMDQPQSGSSTVAFYNALLAGADNAVYAADMSALQAAVLQEGAEIARVCREHPGAGECKPVACQNAALYPGCVTFANPAETALQDFNAYMNYLLYLLGLTQDSATTGMNWTPQETADIEAAITACLNSPSTCAATIANLNAELASLGVPPVFTVPGGAGQFGVLSTPAQIVASGSMFRSTIAPPDNTLSFTVGYWRQVAANEP